MRDGGLAPHNGPVWAAHFAVDAGSCAPAAAVHEYGALAFYTEGHARIDQRGQLDVRAGDVHLIPAGEPHRLLTSQNGAAWGIGFGAACFASTELAAVLEPFERARAGSSAVIHIAGDRQAHLAALCAELSVETSATRVGGAHAALVQTSLLSLVLAEVARAASGTSSTARPSLVADALRFIERNCLRPLSLREVAAAVHRSPSHVTTAVRRATGKSVVEWIVAGRLAEARSRLLLGDEMVDVIAERVGYADATHFIRMFRRAHGVTPAAWRAQQRASR